MASLHTLLTALIRLIGIYYVFKAVDIMLSALTYYGGLSNFDTNLQQTSIVYIIVQLIFAVLIFLIAPKLAQLMVGEKEGAKDVDLSVAVIFCTGVMIIAWGFSKIADMIDNIFYDSSSNSDATFPEFNFNLTTRDSIYFLTSCMMILGGVFIIIKCQKIATKFLSEK